MKIVIDIPKEEYEEILSSEDCGLHTLTKAVANGRRMKDNENINILIELLEEIRSLKEINNSDNRYDKGYQHGRSSCEAIIERKISILKERS